MLDVFGPDLVCDFNGQLTRSTVGLIVDIRIIQAFIKCELVFFDEVAFTALDDMAVDIQMIAAFVFENEGFANFEKAADRMCVNFGLNSIATA